MTIADASSVHTFDVMDGTDGQPGEQGADGVSPAATVSKSGNVATITIIDKNGTTTAQISDGAKGETGATGPKGDTGAQGVQGPKGDTGDKGDQGPKGDKGDTGAQGAKGDPGDDYVLTAQDKADIAGMVDVPVTDVQVNGTSILSNGVANLPVASNTNFGVAKVSSGYYGVGINSNNQLTTIAATVSEIKGVSQDYKPITASYISPATFYGLAKAAGDTTQSASSNAVGNYTESAKSAIGEMLGGSVSVSGTTPTIVAKAGIRYVCGEVSTLDFTPSATGICDVVFASGSTPAVLTVPNTVKWPAWFDPTSLEANTTYELNVMNGTLGAVGVWT